MRTVPCGRHTAARRRILSLVALLLTACSDDSLLQDATPIPVCQVGDGLTSIPVWQPWLDENGNLSSDPPQQDGLVVYIRLYQDAASASCHDEALNTFSRPANPQNMLEGGLAVNIRGNTQFANGICYFTGYYMNEEVMGMHQGWIETYYGAVDKQDVVVSGRYCLSQPIE